MKFSTTQLLIGAAIAAVLYYIFVFKKKENTYYSEVLRDMNSYPPISKEELYRSMLHDGKRIFSFFFVIRFVFDLANKGAYSELKNLYYKFTDSANQNK